MRRLTTALATTATALVVALGLTPSAQASGAGYDISYPQCGKALPNSASFVVVGVNGGRPFSDNPCLGEQFKWVKKVKADYAFYVNSANPGIANKNWGQPGVRPCNGTASDHGCAYNYGQASAKHAYDYASRVTGAAQGHRFWVDVELYNSWSKTDLASNLAVIQGMIDYLTNRSGRVAGIYSTPNHWKAIANNAQARGVPTWFAATVTRAGAASKCAAGPVLSGGPLLMVQYVVNNLDHNYWCGRSAP